ncbi:hypothetical protein Esti_001205 [Eimeria stiedai]
MVKQQQRSAAAEPREGKNERVGAAAAASTENVKCRGSSCRLDSNRADSQHKLNFAIYVHLQDNHHQQQQQKQQQRRQQLAQSQRSVGRPSPSSRNQESAFAAAVDFCFPCGLRLQEWRTTLLEQQQQQR